VLNVQSPAEVERAIQQVFGHLLTDIESVGLFASLGRMLASDIVAEQYVPGFDRSTVDGYAVWAADTFGASFATPAMLSCRDGASIGEKPQPLEKGQCQYVPTGGEIPQGADAMVMIEDVEDYGDGMKYVLRPTAPGRHIGFRGDDVSPGKCVMRAGWKIRPQDIGTLAALGIQTVAVRKKPVVGILSTGDELVDIHVSPERAQIRDVNTYTLSVGVLSSGGEPVRYGIIKDDYVFIKNAIVDALRECDIVLLSGGSSVGTLDYARQVIEALVLQYSDSKILLHGIAIKPGKPTLISSIRGKPVFGLPGHPMAAYLMYKTFVSPLIAQMMGHKEEHPTQKAILSVNIPSNNGREELAPVKLSEKAGCWTADPIMGKSGLISILSEAGGYVRIPRDQEGAMANTEITVYLL